MVQSSSSRSVALVAICVTALSLAGCVGSSSAGESGASGLAWDSFESAMSADGPTVSPANGTAPVKLKLLSPSDPTSVAKGKTDVAVLLFDPDSSAPISDAEMKIEAMMPSMGHGTNPEEDPTHKAHGVYVGMTNFMMPGGWVLNLDATLASGDTVEFDVDVTVGTGGGGSGSDGGTGASFSSFEDALNADGEEFAPVGGAVVYTDQASDSFTGLTYSNSFTVPLEAATVQEIDVGVDLAPGTPADEITVTLNDPDGEEVASVTASGTDPQQNLTASDVPAAGEYTLDVSGRGAQSSYILNITVAYPAEDFVTLKLLDPADPGQVEQGAQPLVFLLYNPASEEPVTDASVTLKSWMPSMGHGTSDETDPTHQAFGVYEGETNHVMGGEWIVNLDATLGSGLAVPFEIPFQVQE